jgi:hypothetical protein
MGMALESSAGVASSEKGASEDLGSRRPPPPPPPPRRMVAADLEILGGGFGFLEWSGGSGMEFSLLRESPWDIVLLL